MEICQLVMKIRMELRVIRENINFLSNSNPRRLLIVSDAHLNITRLRIAKVAYQT